MDLLNDDDKPLWNQLRQLAAKSTRLFVKKLSRNDTSWADNSGLHQAGFYIPREIRESGFFPPLTASNPDKPHIFRAACPSLWPQTGELKRSNLSHYSNKGPETHFTTIPHEVFRGLNPASLLVCGHLREPVADIANYWFIVLDSDSDESELLETALDLQADFRSGLFDVRALDDSARIEEDQTAELIERIEHALRTGTLERFINEVTTLPSPAELAGIAKAEYLAMTGEPDLNPFRMDRPGDAIMKISRDIEYTIFRRFERKRRAAEVVSVLANNPTGLVGAVVRGFAQLDSIFLSASQQRKTRAGRSFEFHIASVLRDGGIPFEEQTISGSRRPDFILPNLKTLESRARDTNEALVIAAKTTLRDRWKGVNSESLRCTVYLATVDDRVMSPVLSEMKEEGIVLVVPESLKASKETVYGAHANVISLKDFAMTRIPKRLRTGP